MYDESIRYAKGLGNNAIHARLIYKTGFWDWQNLVLQPTETANCKFYLKELSDSSATQSWYYGALPLPTGGPYSLEIILDSTGETIGNDLVWGSTPLPQTSGSTSFNPTRDLIVNRALRMVGAYASTDVARPEQITDADDCLNLMLKSWQIENHLWLKKFAELTLVQGQNTYHIGASSTDICNYTDTGLQAARPTRIFSATRKQSNSYEIPIISTSRADYHALPNKVMQGRVVQYYYDPQLSQGNLMVWPTPDNSGDTLVLSLDRPIQDILADDQTADLPQEWIDCLCYGLALRLAPEYGVSMAERQILQQEYAGFKTALLEFDIEDTSIYFQRSRY